MWTVVILVQVEHSRCGAPTFAFSTMAAAGVETGAPAVSGGGGSDWGREASDSSEGGAGRFKVGTETFNAPGGKGTLWKSHWV